MAIDILAAFENEPPELDFIFNGFLAGTVGALVAPGASGKSYWSLQAAMGIACAVAGGDLLSLNPVTKGQVVYLAGEDPEIILNRRIHAIGSHLNKNERASIASNLIIEPLMGRRLDVMNDREVNNIVAACAGSRLIIIDTLSRVHQLNEMDNGDMSRVISQFEYIAVNTGASVLYLHHVAKGTATTGTGDQQQAARGASALIDNARWCGFVQKMTKEEASKLSERSGFSKKTAIGADNRKQYVKFGVSKQNYGEHTVDKWFKHVERGVLLPVEITEITEWKKEDNSTSKTGGRKREEATY